MILIEGTQYCFGREPNEAERSVIDCLTCRASEQYNHGCEHVLIEMHKLADIETKYERVGSSWEYLGFQGKDPVSDIRGGGLLALNSMNYFLYHHKEFALDMIYKRSKCDITSDLTLKSFPWAAAGMNLSRMVTALFEAVDMTGRLNTGGFSRKTYWNMILEKESFNRLFSLAFLLLDCLWDEMNANYMEFQFVITAVKMELLVALICTSTLLETEKWVHQRVGYNLKNENCTYFDLPDCQAEETESFLFSRSLYNDAVLAQQRENGTTDGTSAKIILDCKNCSIKQSTSETPDFLSSDFKMTLFHQAKLHSCDGIQGGNEDEATDLLYDHTSSNCSSNGYDFSLPLPIKHNRDMQLTTLRYRQGFRVQLL